MPPTIESLEARLAELRIDQIDPLAHARVRDERARIQTRLAELRKERAESWVKQDWLSFIEAVIDDLGRLVERGIMRRMGA